MEPPSKANEERLEPQSSTYHNRKNTPGTPEYLYETIRDMNAFSEKDMSNPGSIEKIELVLEELYNLNGLSVFTNLRSLTLINVNIKKIENMNKLQNLTELWLNENLITKLEGLEGLTQLKSLFICYNQISKIEGLDNLKNLETLWLCNNSIEVIENLGQMEKLKQLSLAGNSIEYIKNSLDNLINLNDFNISGNKISTFKEALNLNRLPNLEILAFYDPHFGENPICNLCNYQTYILYNLRKITKLDTLIISEEAKSFAEATFMKKKMYYNMRIKTIQRSFSNLRKCIKKAQLKKIDLVEKQRLASNSSQSFASQMLHQERIYDDIKKKLSEITELSISRLLIELDTGGNIRLEEGKGNEKWYVSCVDLIKSRFHLEEMQKNYDVIDVNVNRVIRIHNRFLRNKFEENMENLIDSNNGNYKKSLEYLFYGVDPAKTSEINHIIEEGFRSYSEATELGMCGYPALMNSILASDCPRLQNLMKNSLKNKENSTFLKNSKFDQKLMVIPSGVIVICKVLMLKSTIDRKYPNFDIEKTPNEIYKSYPLDDVEYKKGEFGSVFRSYGNDEMHKLWFIFDNNLVLPEYLVEFQYSTKYEINNRMMVFGSQTICELTEKDDEFITPNNLIKYNDKINDIFDELSKKICDNIESDYDSSSKSLHLELKAIDLDRADLTSLKSMALNYFKFCLNEKSYVDQLDDSLLYAEKKKEKEEILILDMKFINSSILPSFMIVLQNLKYLNLSFNKLDSLEILENYCPNLIHLDLSHNLLKKLRVNSSIVEYLDISYNDFQKIEDFALNISDKLIFLNIKGNSLYLHHPFQKTLMKIIETFKNIQFYNNKNLIHVIENGKNLNDEVIINDDKIYENSKFFQDVQINKELDHHWKFNIEILILSHQKIKSMAIGLDELKNLRKLNLSHNRIDKIEGLLHCKTLEELSLEKNNIKKIEGVSHLLFLKKFELGINMITKIEEINQLDNLMQLSLEDNKITTLQEFPDLQNLMEVYLANNLISNPKEIQHLKHLHKLIILDISGNPICKDPNSRIYTLYNLKKLKVLDGVSVEVAEHQVAKDLFTGRLTEEILLSRLNGLSPENVEELDLTNCKLKDFEDIFNENYFPNLIELNISVNLFTSMKMLGNLPKLKILIMNSNKLESLYLSNDMNAKLGLNGCQAIEVLDVSNNNLKDLNGVQYANLKQLKILKADQNEISKLDCLDTLEQLKELDLNGNKIRQFEPNSFINNNPIKCLKIEENGLKNFGNIQKLYKLQHLFASNNRINDLPEMEKLCELPNLKELELNGNTLSKKPGYRSSILKKLPLLLYLDGKEITNEEREKLETATQGGQIYEKNIIQNYYNANPNSKVPVKLNSVNFDGVFMNVRFPSDYVPPNNMNLQKK